MFAAVQKITPETVYATFRIFRMLCLSLCTGIKTHSLTIIKTP